MNHSYLPGSPGLPDSSMPTGAPGFTPRRSSYASVVSGTASGISQAYQRSGAFAHLLNQNNDYLYYNPTHHNIGGHSRYELRGNDMDYNTNGGGHGRSTSWSRGAQLPSFSSAFGSLMNGHPYGGGAAAADLFFIPSYLKGSKYVQKLEEAHRAKVVARREGLSAPSSQPGSLSTSASSVNLHAKLAPSHRGMTYDLIEKAPPVEDEMLAPLPTSWNIHDKQVGLEVMSDGLEVKFTGPKPDRERDHEACAIRADHPMPPQCGLYYFEVTIISRKREESSIGIGFSGPKVPLTRLPGWEPDSWAYHGDDGHSFCCQTSGKHYGPPFMAGDIIGCGVNFRTGSAFFTKNGDHLGTAFRDIKGKLYPSIGMKKSGEHIRVNFGQSPFVFDIDGMMAASNFSYSISSPQNHNPNGNGTRPLRRASSSASMPDLVPVLPPTFTSNVSAGDRSLTAARVPTFSIDTDSRSSNNSSPSSQNPIVVNGATSGPASWNASPQAPRSLNPTATPFRFEFTSPAQQVPNGSASRLAFTEISHREDNVDDVLQATEQQFPGPTAGTSGEAEPDLLSLFMSAWRAEAQRETELAARERQSPRRVNRAVVRQNALVRLQLARGGRWQRSASLRERPADVLQSQPSPDTHEPPGPIQISPSIWETDSIPTSDATRVGSILRVPLGLESVPLQTLPSGREVGSTPGIRTFAGRVLPRTDTDPLVSDDQDLANQNIVWRSTEALEEPLLDRKPDINSRWRKWTDFEIQREKRQIRLEIEATSTTKVAPPLNETELVQSLVLQFLTHDGYVETARAFAEEIHSEKKALSLDPTTVISGYDLKEDEDAGHRQKIRAAILDGDIEKALKYTNVYYPDVLKDNEHVNFRLKCRRFVEMIRQGAELNNSASTNGTKKSNGHSGDWYDDIINQDMDIDEHQPQNNNWDKMDTEETPGNQIETDRLLQETIAYGQDLQAEFKHDPRREVKQALEEAFALMAYQDPLNAKEVSHLLDPSGRVAVAEELNSAILQSLGKSSSAALEQLIQQTTVLLEDLREGGGPGAFVNIDDFARPKNGL